METLALYAVKGGDGGGSGGEVTGVKGNAESTYRKGNVNITAENIGIEDYIGLITDAQWTQVQAILN